MKNFFLKFIFLIVFSGCSITDSTNEPKNATIDKDTKNQNISSLENCICVQLWMPVCGENGKTYSNACFADCAKVKYKQGSCLSVIKD